MRRRTAGEWVLAASLIYSVMDLMGWIRPRLLRLGIHGGARRMAALVLASLTFKAVLLFAGALLAFWPERRARERS